MRWPMGYAPYEMAYERCTPVRGTPMRWPMGETRLWDGPCERHAYVMAYERGTPMRDSPMGDARL
jgi:hypothetical protein